MLTLSYAEATADPTYCDAGKLHGSRLVRTMGVKPNEPRPLKDIFPHCTIPEFLWCLRAVRQSQKQEARIFLTLFVCDISGRVLEHNRHANKCTLVQRELAQKIGAVMVQSEPVTSQAAIDISNLALKYFGDDARTEEQTQRDKLGELINGT